MPFRRRHVLPVIAVAVATAAPASPQRQPTLHDVVERFGAYVQAFERQMASVVAEERYPFQHSGIRSLEFT